MEAARVAALRGHEVTLWEKSGKLGGNLIPAAIADFKQDLRNLIDYLSNQITKLGVHVEFMKEATAERVQQFNADEVIIATGATPINPDIPGANKNNTVICAIDLLLGRRACGNTIVVVGGGNVGCETAVWLAQKGKKVTIAELLDSLVPDMFPANRMNLLQMLAKSGVEINTKTKVLEITDEGVVVETVNGLKSLKADTVVLAVGLKPEKELMESLEDKLPFVHAVGDCVEAREIINAIWEAYHAARLI